MVLVGFSVNNPAECLRNRRTCWIPSQNWSRKSKEVHFHFPVFSAYCFHSGLKYIQKECLINKLTEDDLNVFTTSTLQDYAIQGSSGNSCSGDSGGLISAIPTDTNVYPTFILATNTDELSYSFQGQTGTNFSDYLSLVCSNSESDQIRAYVL